MESKHFGKTDYLVVSLVLVISAVIGIYYRLTGGKQRTTKEYFMADKNMSVFPVACSLTASFLSAVTLLGLAKENYVYGTQITLINLGFLVATFMMMFLYLPVFFKLQMNSAYEYLELRFGRITRLVASGSFIVQTVLYMSIALYAPSIALSTVTGFSKLTSILSVGLVCTFYSTIGGMKAVLWTDVFQTLLMFAAVFTVIIKGVLESNGVENVWNIAVTGGRIKFFNFDLDPTIRHTVWTQVVGGIFQKLAESSVNQTQIQRLLSVKNLRTSQMAFLLSWPIYTFLYLLTSFAGLVIYAKYHDCDPVLSKRISSSDQLLPLFVMDSLASIPGLAGLVVSGILGGALSTISSSINSLAAVTLEDFVKPVLPSRWQNDGLLATFTKVLACAFGILCVALAFVADYLGGIHQAAVTVLAVVGGPLLGLFTLGMFCPRCTQRGAILGFVIAITFSSWIGFGANIEKPYIPELTKYVSGCPDIINDTYLLSFDTSHNNITTSVSNVTRVTTSVSSTSFFFEEPAAAYPPKSSKSTMYLYRISHMWYAMLGCVIVVLIGIVTSSCENKPVIGSDLLSPACNYWFTINDTTQAEQGVTLANITSKSDRKKKCSWIYIGQTVANPPT